MMSVQISMHKHGSRGVAGLQDGRPRPGRRYVPCTRRQLGVTLVEVLVSMLIMSIGLLGLAGLHAHSIRFTSDSHTRDQAALLAVDLAERMRARRNNVAEFYTDAGAAKDLASMYDALVANDKSKWDSECGGVKAVGNAKCCDPTGIAIDDELRCWMWQAKSSLVGVAPTIAANGSDPTFVDITLSWADREPREFSDGIRNPESKTECEAIARRQWEATAKQCLIAQTWTIRP